jgi:hypothetical protein
MDRLAGVAFHEVADDADVPMALLRPRVVAQLAAVVHAARDGHADAALAASPRTGADPAGVRTWTEPISTCLLQDVYVGNSTS